MIKPRFLTKTTNWRARDGTDFYTSRGRALAEMKPVFERQHLPAIVS